ncbi:hypothetical protein K469DRAFT_717687 [Zopfia rhizophila CBS 207.26]|uniref:Uncharacterized protein n=1 Tax=Zopfia rhizophila CBS 207.26 TaxID=1314779 RepID=A0A6A6DHA3_9PEZI|nr:hypothetical protein K469DRAFT_717687 [Zopfia rhizophila CBS 207.26]
MERFKACCGESSTLSTSFRATIRLLNEHKKRDLVSPYAPKNMTIPCSWERLVTLKRLFGMVARCWTVTVGRFGV